MEFGGSLSWLSTKTKVFFGIGAGDGILGIQIAVLPVLREVSPEFPNVVCAHRMACPTNTSGTQINLFTVIANGHPPKCENLQSPNNSQELYYVVYLA